MSRTQAARRLMARMARVVAPVEGAYGWVVTGAPRHSGRIPPGALDDGDYTFLLERPGDAQRAILGININLPTGEQLAIDRRYGRKPELVARRRYWLANDDREPHDDELAAIASVEICQLQASRAFSCGFRWERALVRTAEAVARSHGIPEIRVLTGERVIELGRRWKEPVLTRERAFMRYDVTARRCGFKPGEGYWYREL